MARAHSPSCSLLILLTAFTFLIPGPSQAQTRQIDLEVLVLSAGDSGTEMVKAGLDEGLIPYTEIDLTTSQRPIIDETFLIERPSASVRRARFQAVIFPDEAPIGLSARERAAIHAFEREFRVRQLDAYAFPSAAVQLRPVREDGMSGSLDGVTAELTAAALQSDFSYLKGRVRFDDLSPTVSEHYGHLAVTLPDDPAHGRSFVPLLTAPTPSGSERGVLMGVLHDDGREELVLSAAMNVHQLAMQALFPGIVHWLTRGVHVGTERNFLTVHIDDVFLSDARWVPAHDCTVGHDCPPDLTAPEILMTQDDVHYLLDWQKRKHLMLDMVFNGFGYDLATENGAPYPLGDELLHHKDELRWVSHTYSHLYLGCIQDYSVRPWRCASDEQAHVVWTSYDAILEELTLNLDFARRVGLDVDRDEVVTGEHSGLRRTPFEPSDNPNLSLALNRLGVEWIGSDNSRDELQRPLGSTLTVPRFPLNVFYNVGTKAEEIDEYNWIYTTPEDGGSGICLTDPKSTCIAPLDPVTGFDDYILPQQSRALLLHALSNSPRPHYAHQSNLAEDRLLYPVIDGALAQYQALFTEALPVVNATMAELGEEMKRRTTFQKNRKRVHAYLDDGRLIVESDTSIDVPLTVPRGSLGARATRAGALESGWREVERGDRVRITLPSSVDYAR